MNIKKVIAIIIAVIILVINLAIAKDNVTSFKPDFKPDKLLSLTEPTSKEVVVQEGDAFSKIAVVSVNGVIAEGLYHTHIMDSLENVRNDENVIGVILEVNSPGGGVYESAQIADKIKQIKTEKGIPFYTVMGSVAASGGYYISAPTDKIYAMPETVTGSIGVIMSSTNFSGLLEKYGVSSDVIKSGEFKDIGSSTKPMTESERAILQTLIDNSHSRFVNVIAEGRGMTQEAVKSIADGRIYDGQQAMNIGLVDAFGYYEDVLAELGKALSVDNPQVIRYEYNENIDNILTLLSKSYVNMNKSELQKNIEAVQGLEQIAQNRLMYLYGGM